MLLVGRTKNLLGEIAGRRSRKWKRKFSLDFNALFVFHWVKRPRLPSHLFRFFFANFFFFFLRKWSFLTILQSEGWAKRKLFSAPAFFKLSTHERKFNEKSFVAKKNFLFVSPWRKIILGIWIKEQKSFSSFLGN